MTFVIEAVGLASGGGKELALNLFSRLPHFREHRFVLFLPMRPEYPGLSASNIHCCFYEGGSNLAARYVALQRTLPRICVEYHADSLLCLGNFAPRKSQCPTLVLIQNAHLVCREKIAEQRRTSREKLILAYGRRASRRLPHDVCVVVQTPVMRERLLSGSGLPPERVAVIPCPSGILANSRPELCRESARRDRPFTFLCLARYYAHKNLEILPEALKCLAALTRAPVRCLISISPGQHPGARRLLARIEREALSTPLRNIGSVPSSSLAEVYGAADAVILPTLLESYSATYSEAMHFGLPVLTSDRDFARYLCGDAAAYFDPLDAGSIASTMLAVMENPGLRQTLVARGRRIVAELPSWDDIAACFVESLERTAKAVHCSGALSERSCSAAQPCGRNQTPFTVIPSSREKQNGLPDFAAGARPPGLGTYWRTLRPLGMGQLAALVRRRMLPSPGLPRAGAAQPALRKFSRPSCFSGWKPKGAPRMIESTQILSLNAGAGVSSNSRWQIPGSDRFSLYQLNSFDFLDLDLSAPARRAQLSAAVDLACDWLSTNATGHEIGWEPYPLSKRIVNWLKFLAANDRACELLGRGRAVMQLLASLRVQALALERRLETDIRANHLLKNAKALLFAGALIECPESSRWRREGEAFVRREIAEQVLPDGGHFERSPMYHAQVLQDLLDLDALCASCGELSGMRAGLCEPIARMASYLRGILHPNGDIPLFNDSAFGLTAPPDEILSRAAHISDSANGSAPRLALFPETGYAVFRDARTRDCLIFDCGPLGPACQPGHGHCGVLGYELSLQGRRVVVDTGVSTYERCAERHYERSTAAHNTLRIDGEEQAEIWAAFRLGRRPSIRRVETGAAAGCPFARAEHNGYRHRGVVHRRAIFHVQEYAWVVADSLLGRGWHRIESFIHFHPDVVIEAGGETRASGAACGTHEYAIRVGNLSYRLSVLGEGELRLKQSWYAPQMGLRQRRAALHWTRETALPAIFICAFAPAGVPPVVLRAGADATTIQVNHITLPLE
ncbi:MAG: heparinase II/III domain-containing protein [Terriglobia bacterium]